MINLSTPDLIHLLLSLGSLLLLSRLATAFVGKFNIPAVLVEILLGVLIGPTFLATVAPAVSGWLFPTTGEIGVALQDLSRVAVIMLLFVAGMETNLKALRAEGSRATITALGSFSVPFAVGFLLVLANPLLFGMTPDRAWLLPCFVGVAFAISALPVIIRILMDMGLYQSRIGVITVAAASVMDMLGWVMFITILTCLNPVPLHESAKILWSHMTLLSFIAGIVVGNLPLIPAKASKLLYGFVVSVISPFFFLSIGATLNFGAHLNLTLITVVIVAATLSKLAGTFLAGRLSGLRSKEALALGFALNARGAMEIILSKQALEAGLIQPDLFITLIVMSMFTNVLSGPMVKTLLSSQGQQRVYPFRAYAGFSGRWQRVVGN